MNIVLLIVSLLPFISLADAPENWQIGFQDPATPIMQGIIDLHHDIFFFMLVILLFVIWMLARTFYHFHQSRNPVPEKMLHTSTFFLIIGPFFIWLLITVIPFQSFGMDIESTLSLENVSNSSVTSPAESQDLEEIIPNPELQTGIVAQNQELAVVNDGADSELLTVIDNIDAQNQDLTLVGGNPAYNSEAYVSTSRGNIDALRYSQGCDILGKQSLEAGVTAERSGNIKAATLHFIASKHYAELADSGIRIHQASELAPQFADRARVIHDQLLDIQSVEYSKAAEIDSDNAAAQNRSLSVITSLKTQASDVGVKLKTAVNRTVSSPRVRTAFTMAQAPLIALGAICAKSGADHLFDAFRHR